MPVRGLPIATPVHVDANSGGCVKRPRLASQPATFSPAKRGPLGFLTMDFHAPSQDPTLTIFKPLPNLLLHESRHCFKGFYFILPRIPACSCKDLIIGPLDLHPLATFCPRVRGRAGPEDLNTNASSCTATHVVCAITFDFRGLNSKSSCIFCTPPAEATALARFVASLTPSTLHS